MPRRGHLHPRRRSGCRTAPLFRPFLVPDAVLPVREGLLLSILQQARNYIVTRRNVLHSLAARKQQKRLSCMSESRELKTHVVVAIW